MTEHTGRAIGFNRRKALDEFDANRLAVLDCRYELLCRAECRRQGIAPDEIVADGGHMAWQVVGHEAATKEAGCGDEIAAVREFTERFSTYSGLRHHMAHPHGLTFRALRAGNAARAPMFVNAKGETQHSGRDWSPNDWMVATFGELGEAANVMKKVRRGDMTLTEARPKLGQEFADVLIYLDMLAWECGVELGEAVIQTFNAKSAQLELNLYLNEDGPIRKAPD